MTGRHKINYFLDERDRHGCRCTCGWAPPDRYASRQLVEDEVIKHERNVERARAALKSRNVPLHSERDWYRERENDPNETPENRELWKQMADELDTRLGQPKGSEDRPLF